MGKKLIFVSIFLNICLLISTLFFYTSAFHEDSQNNEVRENFSYKYINPLLECNVDYQYYNPGEIKQKVDSYLESAISDGKLIDGSYYVRLLKNGSNF